MIPLTHFLIISALLFSMGLYAVITRRNAILVLIGVELMLNASILNLVAFGKYDKADNAGQMFAIFIIVLAAASVAVGLAIVLNFYKRIGNIDPNKANNLRG